MHQIITCVNKRRALTALVLLLLGTVSASWAVADSGSLPGFGTFPQEVTASSLSVALREDGRLFALMADASGRVEIHCYDGNGGMIGKITPDERAEPTAAFLQTLKRSGRLILLTHPDADLWRVRAYDGNGNEIDLKEIRNSRQAPIVLEAGIFYVVEENGADLLLHMNWRGEVRPVNGEKLKNASMVWWESRDVEGGYALVVNLLGADGVKHKAVALFDDDDEMRWLYVFNGDFKRYFIPQFQSDGENRLILWMNERGSDGHHPALLCVDGTGNLAWKKRVETRMPYMSAEIIRPLPDGGAVVWGTTGEERLLFELVVNRDGTYRSHDYRRGANLKRYLNGDAYAVKNGAENMGVVFVRYDMLEREETSLPLRLTPAE